LFPYKQNHCYNNVVEVVNTLKVNKNTMDIDKFLKSQTFKTGTFVLLVLFVLLIVFKFGVISGYKKANFSHTRGNNYSQVHGSAFFGHQSGLRNKTIRGELFFKKKLIPDKIMIDSEADKESGAEGLPQ